MSSSAPETPDFARTTLAEFTRELAARRSVPGGGAAAGSALAHAAALGSMVVAFSRGKKTFQTHEPLLEEAEGRLERTRLEALKLAVRDAEGFQALASLWPLPEDDATRIAGWPVAVVGALEPPRDLMLLANETIHLLARLVGRSSRMLRSDLAIAAGFSKLAADAAAWNVRMNLDAFRQLPGRSDEADQTEATMQLILGECRETAERIDRACLEDEREAIVDS